VSVGKVKERFSTISAEEAKRIMDSEPEDSYLLIDVRQPKEYELDHMPGARLIPLGELEERANELDKKKRLIVYCRAGPRSRAGAFLLSGLGFEHVFNISGGMMGWPYQGVKGFPRVGIFMGKEDLITAINLAFFMERGSENFYLLAADKAKNPETKDLLMRLAGVEKRHMRMLYNCLKDKKGEIPPFELYYQLAESDLMEGGMRPDEYFYRPEELSLQDEVHILEIAIELEVVAYDLYRNIAEQAEDEEVRRLLMQVAEEEKAHLRALAETIG
jgi:rhodanese-related sulfurtransferase/rubrerythrin